MDQLALTAPSAVAVAGLWIALATVALPLRADFEAGNKAYEKGDYATAVKEWQPLANDGDPRAQYNLGAMSATGQGMPKDYARAILWFKRAAAQGFALAQTNLGLMHAVGQGVPMDFKEAVRWFRMAADQGEPSAQSNLGVAYAMGQGVPMDIVQAYVWFSLAAEQGSESGKKNKGMASQALSPEQMLEANKIIREWKPKKAEGAK